MSDHANTITVVLENPIKDEACEPILNAIKMIKGVQCAEINVANPQEYMAISRASKEMEDKLWRAIHGKDS